MSTGKLTLLGGAAVALLLAACSENSPTGGPAGAAGPAGQPAFVVRDFGPGDGLPYPEEIELCKFGSSAEFDVEMVQPDPLGPTSLDITLQDATNNISNCRKVGEFDAIRPADITITELLSALPSGYQFDSVTYVVLHGTIPNPGGWVTDPPVQSTTNLFSVTGATHGLGYVVNFYNSLIPSGDGRMTGGGQQTDIGGVDISRGFTIHCDITLSNNLELNWQGYKWHLDKPLTKASCSDDPNIDQRPPVAPLDTFVGEGIGKLNGEDGSLVKFTFVDAGEPGRNDLAKIQVWDVGGNLVLDVPLGPLTHGNIQAHFDQPHSH